VGVVALPKCLRSLDQMGHTCQPVFGTMKSLVSKRYYQLCTGMCDSWVLRIRIHGVCRSSLLFAAQDLELKFLIIW
jgi:hypothetical protein